jgi:Transposase IS200 like
MEKEVNLLCYCLLSNHLHLMLETPQGNLSKLMQPLQTSFTLSFNRRHRHTGHVFEQRCKALVVDRDNYLLYVSCYIHSGIGSREKPDFLPAFLPYFPSPSFLFIPSRCNSSRTWSRWVAPQ